MKRWITALLLCLGWVGFLPMGSVRAYSIVEGDSLNTPLYHYTEGLKAQLIHGDTSSARHHWEEALGLDSLYAPAHSKLGEQLLRSAESEARGLKHIRLAQRIDSTNRFYLSLRAQAELFTGHYPEARPLFRQLLVVERHNPENYRLAALLEEQLGDRETALAILDSAERLFGQQSRLGELRQRMLLAEGRTEEALQGALKAVQAAPYELENHLALGDLYARMRCDSLALQSYDGAFQIDSTHLETLLTLADFHFSRRNYITYLDFTRRLFLSEEVGMNEKVSIFNRFVADERFYREYWPQLSTLAHTLMLCYPREPEVVELYGRHLIATGAVELALEHYKRHLNDSPSVKDYYLVVMEIERYLERPDSTFHYLKEAISRFPREADLHLLYGHYSTLNGADTEQAVAHYRRAAELSPSDSLRSLAYGYIGDLYQVDAQGNAPSTEEAFRLGKRGNKGWKRNIKRCYAAYDLALEFDPDNSSVLNNYAYFLSLEERDLERALQMAMRANRLSPSNPTFLDTQGWVLYTMGRHEEARRILHQALSLDGQRSGELLLHYADVLAVLGEDFMAETYYKRAQNNGCDAEVIALRLAALAARNENPMPDEKP